MLKPPTLIRELPRKSKTDRHTRGLFRCGYCGKEFISTLYDVFAERTKSCGCRRKTNCREHHERLARTTTTPDIRKAVVEARTAGEKKTYICKRLGINPRLYQTIIRIGLKEADDRIRASISHPTQESFAVGTGTPLPLPEASLTRADEVVSSAGQVGSPSPSPTTVINNYGQVSINQIPSGEDTVKPYIFDPFPETGSLGEKLAWYKRHPRPADSWN